LKSCFFRNAANRPNVADLLAHPWITETGNFENEFDTEPLHEFDRGQVQGNDPDDSSAHQIQDSLPDRTTTLVDIEEEPPSIIDKKTGSDDKKGLRIYDKGVFNLEKAYGIHSSAKKSAAKDLLKVLGLKGEGSTLGKLEAPSRTISQFQSKKENILPGINLSDSSGTLQKNLFKVFGNFGDKDFGSKKTDHDMDTMLALLAEDKGGFTHMTNNTASMLGLDTKSPQSFAMARAEMNGLTAKSPRKSKQKMAN
jgi:hypothetical protein